MKRRNGSYVEPLSKYYEQAEASKYNNEMLNFRTPNIILVYSNENPLKKELSKV